jgi:endonuclease YncB( thermonuclease family)
MNRKIFILAGLLGMGPGAVLPVAAKLADVKTIQLQLDPSTQVAREEVEKQVTELFADHVQGVKLTLEPADMSLYVGFSETPVEGDKTLAYRHEMRLYAVGNDRFGLYEKIYWSKDIDGAVSASSYSSEWKKNLKTLVKDLSSILGETEQLSAQVIDVLDGDTMKVVMPDRDANLVTIRLNGVDAPEKSQRYGPEAKKFTESQVLGQNVTIVVESTDRYGRLLGDVRYQGKKSLEKELLKAGWAWWYNQYSNDPELADLEGESEQAKRGLWKDRSPTPPWEYRKAQKAR